MSWTSSAARLRAAVAAAIVLALAALGTSGCASVGPDPNPDPPPGSRVTDISAVSGFRGTRQEVANRVAVVARREGYEVTPVGVAPDTLRLGPFALRGCQVRLPHHV